MEIIEDDELRDLFKAETEEHTDKMEKGLLQLERDPQNAVLIEDILREAHSMKGAARMLGVTGVEVLSHRFEDILKEMNRGDRDLGSENIDLLEGILDDLRTMAEEAVSGKPCGITLADALAKIDSPEGEGKESTSEVAGELPEQPALDASGPVESPIVPAEAVPSAVNDHSLKEYPEGEEDSWRSSDKVESGKSEVTAEVELEKERRSGTGGRRATDHYNYQINTIRVEPKKLDTLMTLVGELAVEKTHIERHLSETERIISLWKDISGTIGKSKLFNDDEHLSASAEKMGMLLNQLHQTDSDDYSSLSRITEGLEEGIRALRLLPLSTVFNLFVRSVRDLARELSKEVQLIIEGGDATADKHLIEMMKDPLMHLIRNAICHGIEDAEGRLKKGKPATATIRLRGRRTSTHIVIEVEDDGKGLDAEIIKKTALRRKLFQQDELDAMSEDQLHGLIFSSGFSTNSIVTDISGRGVGLNVVKTNVEQLKGSIEVKSGPGQGCQFAIHLPITLATTRIFLVIANGITYALPVEFVRMVRYISDDEIFLLENRETVAQNGEAISVSWLADLLEYSDQSLANDGALLPEKKAAEKNPCLFLAKGEQQLGLFVDELLDELEVILKPPGAMLQRVRNVSGVTILGSGEICVVLNPFDLMKTVQNRRYSMTSTRQRILDGDADSEGKRPLILLAEDSITTRTQEKRILENAGYDVVTAVDGQSALKTLPTRPFDALISDVEMPNMNGLSLVENVRKIEDYREFPIILVTSLRTEEDVKRGMEVGADAYITKANFNKKILLETLRRLI